ncbi:hypothetical protein BpHYR1_000405 [Brachionus plicatilis]|uniref:Uncharacterized protein n=1 Tax=Brachionus plicatilis TaxID=10195 RepID=A0A3M7QPC2_BRAPC|nr:hypothetical protein BpHYR1_000405 [Brachionus plicatilis]
MIILFSDSQLKEKQALKKVNLPDFTRINFNKKGHFKILNIKINLTCQGATNFAVRYRSNIDAKLYQEILSDYLSIFGASNNDLDFKLHQDNDPKHRSLFLPILNPIELIWNELKQYVRQRIILSEADAEMAIKEIKGLLLKHGIPVFY